ACSSDDTGGAGPNGNDGGLIHIPPPTPPPAASCPTPQPKACSPKSCTAQLGEPSMCVAGACVKAKSLDCQDTLGVWDDDNTVVIGVLLNQRGSDVVAGKARTDSVNLAIQEINQESGGVLSNDPCVHYPLAAVVCDDSNAKLDPDAGGDAGTDFNDRIRAANH